MAYFSRRNKKFTTKVTNEFWIAFKAYVNELCEYGWLWEFGEWVSDFGNVVFNVNYQEVNQKMAQEMGKQLFPLDNLKHKPTDEVIFDLTEFFFNYVAKPVNDGFDRRKGTYEYTIRINNMFDNFRLKYKLKKGKVGFRHSDFIDKSIDQMEFSIPDEETVGMINQAIEKFQSRDLNERKIALEKIVDAYQRISSWEDQDKKKSIEKMLKKISAGDEEIANILDKDSRELWQIANNFMIRHTEKEKTTINDPDCIEYLFYSYFNAIRFILKKYGYIKEKIEEKEKVDELPF